MGKTITAPVFMHDLKVEHSHTASIVVIIYLVKVDKLFNLYLLEQCLTKEVLSRYPHSWVKYFIVEQHFDMAVKVRAEIALQR